MFYGLAFSILLVLICFIVPDDSRNDSTIHNWIILLSIISLLAFIFWMIYLLRFNVFKRFGKWGRIDTGKSFFLYFLIVLLIVSWPFIPPVVQSIRANRAFSDDELIRDINNMNIKLCLLEKDSIDTRFSRDTFQVKDFIEGGIRRNISYDENMDGQNLNNYYFIDTATIANKLAAADSIRRINDSVYVIYECPEYQFIYNFFTSNNNNLKVLQSMDLFRQVMQYKQVIDTSNVKKELAALFSKYSKRHNVNNVITTYDYYIDASEPTYTKRIRDKYGLYYINNNIGNIAEKKYRWDNETVKVSWRVAYYITLALALLVIIYRHTTRRTFFLSLLSAVVLTILTGLFLAMSISFEGSFYTWIIVYFIIFGSLAATIVRSSHRNVVSGIALNLLILITPFMPLVITAFYYSSLRNKYEFSNVWDNYRHLFVNERLHYFMSEIGGFILLLILLATLYQMLYRKWYSLPEQ